MPTATKISTLWIVVLFNIVFADILSVMYPGFISEVSSGVVEGVTLTPALLVIAAVFLEVAIAMIYLARALRRGVSRTVNLVAVAITILFVVGGGSLKAHYIFFASIEVAVLLYIAFLAWNWKVCEITDTEDGGSLFV